MRGKPAVSLVVMDNFQFKQFQPGGRPMQNLYRTVKYYATSPDKLTDQLARPFRGFFQREAASSILLIAATAAALFWANSQAAETYHHFWEAEVSLSFADFSISRTFREWIDEGLMTIFFFTVGLEIKREILVGELASLKKALLPVGAAVGGMIFPALIYTGINRGLESSAGWGIPMATDIAFALGALFVFGRRLPIGLRIFLSALAIADDLGAVLVIALFYTGEISRGYLAVAGLLVACIALANFLWIRLTLVYALLGIGLWFAVLGSGLHATVAGVIVALFIPARGKYDTDKFLQEVSTYLGEFQCPPDGCGRSILLNQRHLISVQAVEHACHDVETPLQRLEQALHPWVAFFVIPLFALANAGLTVSGIDIPHAVVSPILIGIAAGLFLGKPIGITLFSYLFVKARLAALPAGTTWLHIAGAGVLGGIGFTMSLFISALSFRDAILLDYAKLGILVGSMLSGLIGMAFLLIASTRRGTLLVNDHKQ